MGNWIKFAPEPQKLYLAWQAPDHLRDRFRWAVGILQPARSQIELRYLRAGSEFERLNQGHSYEKLLALGYQGYPAFGTKREFHSNGVLEALMRRLPPRNRPDFQDYMSQFRLNETTISDFALLGVTEAKLPSDGFSVVDPLNPDEPECDLLLEVAGFRYYQDQLPVNLKVGSKTEILAEPDNMYDQNAVKVSAIGRKIGNINRLQAPTFLRWLKERRLESVVERLNGKPDRPRAFIFVRIRPRDQKVAA